MKEERLLCEVMNIHLSLQVKLLSLIIFILHMFSVLSKVSKKYVILMLKAL